MDARDFEAAGLYDPDSPKAVERLELLEWLGEQGFTIEEMQHVARESVLTRMAGDRALRPNVKHTLHDLMKLADVDAEMMEEMRRAVGYAEIDTDAPVFTDQDVEGFQNFVLAQQLFSTSAVVAFTRTLGSSLARIADAADSMFIADVESNLVERGASELETAQANLAGIQLVDSLPPSIEAIFRVHMQQTLQRSRRARQQVEVTSGTDLARMAIGFVDLSGYTSLTRALDIHSLSELVERFEAIASDAALAHGARVVKLVGDAVMYAAVEPSEAVRVAADLLRTFADDAQVRTHGGIAFGDVLARGGDYYGPVVNLAARLAEVAVPGEVLVTSEIAPAVEGLEPAGRRMLKGFDEPVELFSLAL